MNFTFAAVLLFSTPCLALSCSDAWNYTLCAYPALRVASFPGATVGDQIFACVSALPQTGGVCDARDMPSGGVIPAITLNRSGATLLGPCGLFTVTGTISIVGANGFTWKGCGATFNNTGTVLVWAGDAASPMLRERGVRDSVFSDFTLKSSAAQPLAVANQSETLTGFPSTHNTYRQIFITGTTAAGLGKGMKWCAGDDCGGSGGDQNNDGNFIDNVQVVNYSDCAYSIEHGQSKTHRFMNSSFNAASAGMSGVCTNRGRGAGSFSWFFGLGGGNTVADFDLGAPDDDILIMGANLESSSRFIQTVPATNFWAITVLGGRWDPDKIAMDDNAIVYQMRGPLNITGLNIGSPFPGHKPKFLISANGFARGNATGNHISWDASDVTSDPFISSSGNYWTTQGNVMRDAANNQFAIPDKVAGK